MRQYRSVGAWVNILAAEFDLHQTNVRKHIRGEAGVGRLGVTYRDGAIRVWGRPGYMGPAAGQPTPYTLLSGI